MRIRLRKGKQKEIIAKAKEGLTWSELARELCLDSQYLSHELNNEKTSLKEEVYQKLCAIAKYNLDKDIIEKLGDNWGQLKGSKNSRGSTIRINLPRRDERLAELIGAILGDGNVNYYNRGKKIGVYQIKIAGDSRFDKDYHMNYLKPLFQELFGINGKEWTSKKDNSRFLTLTSKELVEFFIKMGLKSGNKITNQVTIPNWIWKENKYLRTCLRGLIDTDGCVHRMSNKNPNLLRINLKNYNKTLLEDSRNAFIRLGFHPSNITSNTIYLSRQSEINKYLKDIGFSNKKHIDRLANFKSLVV